MRTDAVSKCVSKNKMRELEAARVRLIDIQKLQFVDKRLAESVLLSFLQCSEDSNIARIELNPKPESLNSINGFVAYNDGERYFFKMHVEENERLEEYYNVQPLTEAGYPLVSARQITSRPGKQLVLYEILNYPTLFDLLTEQEDESMRPRTQQLPQVQPQKIVGRHYVEAQQELDKKTFEIYQRTLQPVTAAADARAPIHQLFSHRLAEDGRLGLFYRGKEMQTAAKDGGAKDWLIGAPIAFNSLANLRWIINGVTYEETLNQIIQRARAQLAPSDGPSIIGHGDAHNGNLFFDADERKLLMFDPAFAGRHHPLLDLTKPLFHNVFARWMYYPEEVANEFELKFNIAGDVIEVQHSFKPSQLRLQFLQSRVNNVLAPTVQLLQARAMLRDDWETYLRSALFCCPFLTVNLFAPHKAKGTLSERYPLSIKMLGLAMAIEFGSIPKAASGASSLSEMIGSIFR